MEQYLVHHIHSSLSLGLHDNARFLAERLVAQAPTEVCSCLHRRPGGPCANTRRMPRASHARQSPVQRSKAGARALWCPLQPRCCVLLCSLAAARAPMRAWPCNRVPLGALRHSRTSSCWPPATDTATSPTARCSCSKVGGGCLQACGPAGGAWPGLPPAQRSACCVGSGALLAAPQPIATTLPAPCHTAHVHSCVHASQATRARAVATWQRCAACSCASMRLQRRCSQGRARRRWGVFVCLPMSEGRQRPAMHAGPPCDQKGAGKPAHAPQHSHPCTSCCRPAAATRPCRRAPGHRVAPPAAWPCRCHMVLPAGTSSGAPAA